MKKYWLPLLLVAVLCCGILAVSVNAADGFSAHCEFCNRTVTWTAITSSSQRMTETNGHYYMSKGLAMTNQTIAADNTVCLLLNTAVYTANKTITVSSGATLNIQGTGTLRGRSTDGYAHGAVWVKEGGTLNLRNTTVDFEFLSNRDGYLQTGGLFYVEGTVNAVGCTMSGGYAAEAGGNVYITETGLLNLENSSVTRGTAPTGNCIYNSGKVQVSGASSVENLLNAPASGGPALGEMLTVKGTYTGSLGLTLPESTADGADIGNLAEGGSIAKATLQIANKELGVAVSGTDLVTQLPPAATVNGTAYPTLEQAVAAASQGQTVKLAQSLGAVTLDKSIVLDLNGCDIAALTVTGNASISLADSQTADFTVADGRYGKIGSVTGNAAPYCDSDIRYLAVEENDGTSYHAVAFSINKMTLRSDVAGLFFKSTFRGDEKVAGLVDSFGVAMSLTGTPNDETLKNPTHFTSFPRTALNGDEDATGTLLQNILKTDNGYNTNQYHARLAVYGRPYIKLTDNTVLWGTTKNRSLREQLEGINNKEADLSWLSPAQTKELSSLYYKYQRVLASWDTGKIHNAWLEEEDKTLKVLAITSSFGLNTTQLIHEIAAAEGMDLTVGRLYASGCTLEKHVNSFKNDLPTYTYTKNNGTWTTVEGATMAYGLTDEYWDVIFIQQSAAQSPLVDTYKDYIDQLMNHLKKQIPNPDVRYIWNMTWAYQADSTQSVFVDTFKGDQMAMYNSILNAIQEKVVPRTDFDAIIPSGTAIQNARTSYFGDTLTKDTYHLNNLGRAIAGYTLYATLTGKPLTEVNLGPVNSYDLPTYLTLTDADRQVIIESVNNAIASPWEVTPSQYPTAE